MLLQFSSSVLAVKIMVYVLQLVGKNSVCKSGGIGFENLFPSGCICLFVSLIELIPQLLCRKFCKALPELKSA
ncbi:hypothetical protein LOK49_LG09G00663 [Camellia lanceoleosa]|uniref:Uncharacterized protein n=1 Tax=Camellia lanceoleosa TaxID=1840588 RepID=A0ACC0GFZ6_9ERIC|nr:hypothetical protein LOK49_LG09G00663 [Camellia lanceoleosa]